MRTLAPPKDRQPVYVPLSKCLTGRDGSGNDALQYVGKSGFRARERQSCKALWIAVRKAKAGDNSSPAGNFASP
jgi:hypothetical protein